MNRLNDLFKRKLRSRSGESIAETLVAVLVAALALTMLAGAISASLSIMKKARSQVDNYYNAANVLVQRGDTIPANTPASKGESKLQVTLRTDSPADPSTLLFEVNIQWYKNSAYDNKEVVAYVKKP